MACIDDITDYVISRIVGGGGSLNQLKLQKLLYYTQAWHLAHHDTPLFAGRFQAWIHGPVNRGTFDRFRGTKMLYSPMSLEDIRPGFHSEASLTAAERGHIDAVLAVYAPLTGDQLETMSHREQPWLLARGGIPPDVRCEAEIDEQVMGRYYRARLQS